MGDHRWFERSTREKRPVARENVIIIIKIIYLSVYKHVWRESRPCWFCSEAVFFRAFVYAIMMSKSPGCWNLESFPAGAVLLSISFVL